MTKFKRKLFTVFFCLVGVGLGLSSAVAQATLLDVELMAVFSADDGLQVAINQVGTVTIEIYDDIGGLNKVLEPPFDTGGILHLDWDATGTRLAAIYVTGTQHPNIVIWDVATSVIVAKQQTDFAQYVYWNPVDSDVLMIVLGTTIVIWDISDNTGPTNYDPSWTDIEYAEWSPHGNYIALLGNVGNIRVIDAETHAVAFERYENLPVAERINYYFSLNFSPDEDRIALYDLATVEVEIWNINTGQMEVSFDSFDTNSQHYEVLRWLNQGLIGIDFRLKQVVIYDLNDGSFVHIVDGVEYSGVITSPSDNTLWFIQPQLQVNSPFFVEVELPRVDTSAPTSTPASASAQLSEIPLGQAAWSPDGRFIAAFNTEPEIDTIEVFTSDLRPVVTLQLDTTQDDLIRADARNLVWSPNSTSLTAVFIVGVADGDPRPYTVIWDTASGTQRVASSFQGIQISWSPSGNYLAVSETILDATTGAVVNSLGNFFRLNWVVWHPTNENQVILGFDQEINVVQPFTGEVITTYPYSGSFRPNFTPDGQYLAVENGTRGSLIVDIVDTSTYQQIETVEPTGSLGEPFGIRWLTNDELALTIVNAPHEIWNPFTQEIVDTVSVGISAWNPQGTQILSRTSPLNNPFGRPPLSVHDRETEGIVAQLSTQDTARKLSLTDQAGSPLRALLSGTDIINNISSDEAADGLIEAFTYPDEVGSVAFDLNGTVTIDNTAPYTLPLPSVGTYTLSATPYSAADAQGEAGLAFTAVIRIGEDTEEAVPTP